jgi:hypothetical protein
MAHAYSSDLRSSDLRQRFVGKPVLGRPEQFPQLKVKRRWPFLNSESGIDPNQLFCYIKSLLRLGPNPTSAMYGPTGIILFAKASHIPPQ